MTKCPQGKTSVVFTVFYLIANLFLRIMAWSIDNISLHQCYSKTFTANSHFLLRMQKFSPVDVFPYMAYTILKLRITTELSYPAMYLVMCV